MAKINYDPSVEDFLDNFDYDKIIPKESEFMDVYEAFGNGRLEPQKTLIYFNKKLLEIEEDLARNPDYGQLQMLQRQKAEIEDYLKKINKILGIENLTKKTEPVKTDDQTTINDEIYNSLPASIQLQVNYLFSVHPKFKMYFPYFKEAGYIEIFDENIQWKMSKRALTKFIKLFAGDKKKFNWAKYQILFDRSSLRTGEGAYTENPCVEYEELVKKVEGELK